MPTGRNKISLYPSAHLNVQLLLEVLGWSRVVLFPALPFKLGIPTVRVFSLCGLLMQRPLLRELSFPNMHKPHTLRVCAQWTSTLSVDLRSFGQSTQKVRMPKVYFQTTRLCRVLDMHTVCTWTISHRFNVVAPHLTMAPCLTRAHQTHVTRGITCVAKVNSEGTR